MIVVGVEVVAQWVMVVVGVEGMVVVEVEVVAQWKAQ